MDNITTKTDYDGTTTPAPATEVHAASEYNDRRAELQGAVTDSGQALDAADPTQLAKASFANAVGAQSMLDSGAANTVVLTPVTGASGLRVATPVIKDYSLLDGAIFSFKANATNIGNMTANVGQTVCTLIGAQPLFMEDGTTDIPVSQVEAGKYYNVRYDHTLDVDGAFVLLLPIPKKFPAGPTDITVVKDTTYQVSTTKNAFLFLIQLTAGNPGTSIKLGIVSPPTVVVAKTNSNDTADKETVMIYVPAGWYFRVEDNTPVSAYYITLD